MFHAVGPGDQRAAGQRGDAAAAAAHDTSDAVDPDAWSFWWRVVVTGPDGFKSATRPVPYSGDLAEVPDVFAGAIGYTVDVELCAQWSTPWAPRDAELMRRALARMPCQVCGHPGHRGRTCPHPTNGGVCACTWERNRG